MHENHKKSLEKSRRNHVDMLIIIIIEPESQRDSLLSVFRVKIILDECV